MKVPRLSCLAALVMSLAVLRVLSGGIAEARTEPIADFVVAVEMLRPVPGELADRELLVLVELLNDLLPQHLERALSGERGLYAKVKRIKPVLEDTFQSAESVESLHKENVRFVIQPTLEVTSKGLILRTRTSRVPSLEDLEWDPAAPVDTSVIGPETGFDSIDGKVATLAEQIANRLTSGPRQRVLVWCVSPMSDGAFLASLSRQITLEIPFFLDSVERERDQEFEFVGMSPWDFNSECRWQAAQSYRRSPFDFDQYDWVLSGDVDAREEGLLILRLRARARGARGTVPLETLEVPIDGDEELLDRVAWPMNELFHAAAQRFE